MPPNAPGEKGKREKLVHAPQAGLAALYAAYRPELLRFLITRTGDPAEAEDVLQELWLRVHAAGGSPVANGRAYLYRAAQNLVLDRMRERRRRSTRDRDWSVAEYGAASPGETADPRPGAEQAMEDQQRSARLATAIAALPPAAGRVFRLHKLDGLPHADVARELGITRSGVEKHMATAMTFLRRSLRD